MTAFNVVRFRVKPGREDEFVQLHRGMDPGFKNFQRGALVKTGERSFCFIGEWQAYSDIVEARPQMVALLDRFRDMLEDLGGDLGQSDPVSGEAVVLMGA